MTKRPRRNHTAALEASLALAALKGEKKLTELAQDFGVHPNQISSGIGLPQQSWYSAALVII